MRSRVSPLNRGELAIFAHPLDVSASVGNNLLGPVVQIALQILDRAEVLQYAPIQGWRTNASRLRNASSFATSAVSSCSASRSPSRSIPEAATPGVARGSSARTGCSSEFGRERSTQWCWSNRRRRRNGIVTASGLPGGRAHETGQAGAAAGSFRGSRADLSNVYGQSGLGTPLVAHTGTRQSDKTLLLYAERTNVH